MAASSSRYASGDRTLTVHGRLVEIAVGRHDGDVEEDRSSSDDLERPLGLCVVGLIGGLRPGLGESACMRAWDRVSLIDPR